MKSLSRNEMKNVKGGGPVLPGCNYGGPCMYYDGESKFSICGNVWVVNHFICGCIGNPQAQICSPDA